MNNTPKKKYKVVYTVVEREKDGRSFWLKVGAAFPNRDGSLSVLLDAVPTNGQLQIRDPKPFEGNRGRDSQLAENAA